MRRHSLENSESEAKSAFQQMAFNLSFVFPLMSGWTIWGTSTELFGTSIPWSDAGLPYWIAVVAGSCLLGTLLCPRYIWLSPLAVCCGQLACIETSGLTGLFSSSPWLLVPLYSAIPASLGSLLAYFVRKFDSARYNQNNN